MLFLLFERYFNFINPYFYYLKLILKTNRRRNAIREMCL